MTIKRDKTPTIKDIAAKAGVSIGTVSRVLNKKEIVSEKTRKKVEQVVKELGYIPNEMARSLLRNKSKTIALIMPDLSNPFYAELFQGVEDIMSSEGYYVFVCDTSYKMENEHRYIKEMIGRGVDGMIFLSLYYCGEEIFNLVNNNVAAVAVQTYSNNMGMDLVTTDVENPSMEAYGHLIKLGHKKIAYVCIDKTRSVSRINPYLSALREAGIPLREEYIIDGYSTDTLGYMATEKLLELHDPPTAIQFINDYTALGAYNVIYNKGLRIPDDLSVIGYDDIKISKFLNPPLTTISQPIREMGRTAGEMLIKSINGDPNRIKREIRLPGKLIIRNSTASPKESV